MTTVIQRQRSRRRLAALTFLSNISLDGSHRDTRLCLYNRDRIEGGEKIDSGEANKENQVIPLSAVVSTSQVYIAPFSSSTTSYRSNIQQNPSLTRDRCSTTTSGGSDRPGVLRKKGTHHLALLDKPQYFSSNESISGNPPNVTGQIRKLSVSISESSGPPHREIKLIKAGQDYSLRDERIVFLSTHKVPFHIFSTVPYNKSKFVSRNDYHSRVEGKRRIPSTTSRPLSTISDTADPAHILGVPCFDEVVEVSYGKLLVPTAGFFKKPRRQFSEQAENSEPNDRLMHPGVARCFSYEPATHKATAHYVPHPTVDKGLGPGSSRILIRALEAGDHLLRRGSGTYDRDDWRCPPAGHTANTRYIPNMLDDPELRAGKHRKLLRFPSYMTSVIDYTKPSELKKELNDKFKEKFPHIQLTLSKLRSLKREILKIAKHECEIDLLTVAQAYVFFERLILKTIVNKPNRKLVAGACLILSAKLNDVKGEVLTNLIEKTENSFRLNRRELMHWEFAALVALEFSLHLPAWQINAHYQRLIFES